MAVEIEHKYLVEGDDWRRDVTSSVRIVQGYIARAEHATVRVRVAGERAFLTVKGPSSGTSRSEFEYVIPVGDAEAMLAELSLGPVIDKVRHRVPVGDHVWEVDVFSGENAPLVLAEVELSRPGESFELPAWAGQDVSEDSRYFNVNLASEPYSRWMGH